MLTGATGVTAVMTGALGLCSVLSRGSGGWKSLNDGMMECCQAGCGPRGLAHPRTLQLHSLLVTVGCSTSGMIPDRPAHREHDYMYIPSTYSHQDWVNNTFRRVSTTTYVRSAT